jgi:hypothetical protein
VAGLDRAQPRQRTTPVQRGPAVTPGISKQVLSRELRELAALGFIAKHDDGYALTAIGERTVPLIGQLHAWGRWMSAQTGTDFDWPVEIGPPGRQVG